MKGSRVPASTYRVQLNRDFRFLDARDLIPYLHALGIGDLYCSPRFRARRGSSHGYDVADPAFVNSELGTESDFDGLCERLKHYDMGLLLDIVPNHKTSDSTAGARVLSLDAVQRQLPLALLEGVDGQ